tara:strand:+ start:121 stop:573 length:453 start_codon:yes stop_codon:yes gene_type:complete
MNLIQAQDFADAIKISEKITCEDFYKFSPNIRKEHELAFAKRPHNYGRWFVQEINGRIYYEYRVLNARGRVTQRLLNEHTLHSMMSDGDLVAVILNFSEVDVSDVLRISKSNNKMREDFFKLGVHDNVFLMDRHEALELSRHVGGLEPIA